ncbi:MAG TPA: hypothetical protein VJP76_01515 [Candidatus Tumulicola sp.]|nr:hypothetical protein [Candidatus Tumulicola sp.]
MRGSYARIVFGAAAVLFGVIALMWHDVDTWQSFARIWQVPAGAAIGAALMAALVFGGIGLPFARTARIAAILLGVAFAVSSLLCIWGIARAPSVPVQYGSFFEQFSLVCGALAAYAIVPGNVAQAVALGRAARLGFGLCSVSFAAMQIFYLKFTASLVPAWLPPNQTFWTILTTIAFGLGAIAMLANLKARLAARLTAVMIALFGLLVWVPAVVTHPASHGNWSEFALNFSIAGAAWLVASAAGADA